MPDLIEFLAGLLTAPAVVLGCTLFGAWLLEALGVRIARCWPRALVALALGIVIGAYAVLGLGLIGWLSLASVTCVWAVMLLVGLLRWRLLPELWSSARSQLAEFWSLGSGARAVAVFLLLMALLSFLVALLPPDGSDWDGLSQHLAQAWTYAHEGRVRPLWHDHHSQFPSTLQMLYTIGMLTDGYVTVRVLHWLMGMLTVLWAMVAGVRFLGRAAGLWAGFVVITTPTFVGLLGLSYVDLGVCFAALGGLYFLLAWAVDGDADALLPLGIMLGTACAIKMQGLPFAGVMAIAALVRAVRAPGALRRWLLAGLLAAALGGPWYLKTYLYTGNPFYPFLYEVFGGRLWSADRAQAYEYHQLNFGPGELPADVMEMSSPRRHLVGPRAPVRWLLGPWDVTAQPWEYNVNPALKAQALLADWVGPLYLPLIVLLLIWKRPRAVGWTMWVFLPLWLWWFYSMQYNRYLLPTLLLLAPVVGYSLSRLLGTQRMLTAGAGTLLAFWSLWALLPLALGLYSAWPAVTGAVTWDRYLNTRLDLHPAASYIARYLPEDAVIATYGEPRSYGFERPVIWGDRAHSDLFGYDAMGSPDDLLARYAELGVTHVLVNPIHCGAPDQRRGPEMALLDDAIRAGLLQPVGMPSRTHLLYRVTEGQPGP
ncbi:MAG TPA: hypothetical protein DGT21_24180 [Armatimonadetes bacterium]|jgi:hypothetical protein|nr:hypothetical protein [Armatimonadota bacterium]